MSTEATTTDTATNPPSSDAWSSLSRAEKLPAPGLAKKKDSAPRDRSQTLVEGSLEKATNKDPGTTPEPPEPAPEPTVEAAPTEGEA